MSAVNRLFRDMLKLKGEEMAQRFSLKDFVFKDHELFFLFL